MCENRWPSALDLPEEVRILRRDEIRKRAEFAWMRSRRVQQEDAYGCTVAAVAMCLGRTYADVRAVSGRDFSNSNLALQIEDWYDYLFAEGFAFYRIWRVTQLTGLNVERKTWPPAPFAPMHLCGVTTAKGGHAVVMFANGKVLDPAKEGVFRLTDYEAVHVVIGLFSRANLVPPNSKDTRKE